MSFDLVWFIVTLAIGTIAVLSYLLGRWHGMEAGLQLTHQPGCNRTERLQAAAAGDFEALHAVDIAR